MKPKSSDGKIVYDAIAKARLAARTTSVVAQELHKQLQIVADLMPGDKRVGDACETAADGFQLLKSVSEFMDDMLKRHGENP